MTISNTHTMRLGGEQLEFEMQGDLVNATRLGAPFGEDKRPELWLATDQAAKTGALIAIVKGCQPQDIIQVVWEEDEYAVWVDMGMAIIYAGWLLPEFRQWCKEKSLAMEQRINRMETFGDDETEDCRIIIGFRRSDDLPC